MACGWLRTACLLKSQNVYFQSGKLAHYQDPIFQGSVLQSLLTSFMPFVKRVISVVCGCPPHRAHHGEPEVAHRFNVSSYAGSTSS
jgi:hypothetical protein